MSSQRSRRGAARRAVARRTVVETLESRQMFSAEPVGGLLGGGFEHHQLSEPDFWYDTSANFDVDAQVGDLEQTLAAANQLTGLTQARNEYGLLGYGQTVAVIDSGIAWDHPNLGGGFGGDYRVVGGWDFSEENDANPYDDGPSGAHGTHVAGIVGATMGPTGDEGVAPGVDLVGLRVFNDQGAGYFGWVEKALRWVHTNRNAFAYPITAVNLSLGTAWNAATVPSWSMLEDEFAQLKSDGIFVAVSAGNSFTTYKTPGLSYPAASSSVVPVMAVDDNGSLSYFSQRHERAIAAPGRTIRSTVPDYVGNQNGQTDDWASFSGTSMAAPYVAGASVLIREAMQFVGYTNITQDTIYDHMMATADDVFDAATNATYKRLNVGAALDALMPDDEFGSTVESAFDLGTIGASGMDVQGTIGSRSDVDYFRFTAAASGTVTFAAATTHYLDAKWAGDGVASDDGLTYTINIVAGQSYTVGLATAGGVGHFELSVTADSSFTFVDWGTVSQQRQLGVGVSGESWYCVTAQQAGYLTAEAFYSAQCQVEIAWFDTNLQQVASGTLDADCQRVDRQVTAGEQLFLRVSGLSDGVDFRLTNLVDLEGGNLLISGTDGDDTLSFTAGATHQIVVNGVAYEIDAASVGMIQIDAGAGQDSITITGTTANETATLRAGDAQVQGAGYAVAAIAVENVVVIGGGGRDIAAMYDSINNDELVARPEAVTLRGPGYENTAADFDYVAAYSSAGGYDRAAFHDSAGDDAFSSRPDRAALQGAGYLNMADRFEFVAAYATSGTDLAYFYDSAGDDAFTGRPDRAVLQGAAYTNAAYGFDQALAYAIAGGYDRATFYDSASNDEFTCRPNRALLQGNGYFNLATGFDDALAYAINGGNDRAVFYDSAGNDVFTSRAGRAVLQGTGFMNVATGFGQAVAYAIAGGIDQALFYDTAGNDAFLSRASRASMQGTGYLNVASGFRHAAAYATEGGFDRAEFQDSPQDKSIRAAVAIAQVAGDGFTNRAFGFDDVVVRRIDDDVTLDTEATDFVFTLIGQ